jgi:hypothetical protein
MVMQRLETLDASPHRVEKINVVHICLSSQARLLVFTA